MVFRVLCHTTQKRGVGEFSVVTKKSQLENCEMLPLAFFFPKVPLSSYGGCVIKYIVQNFVVWFFISQFYLANEEKELWAFFTFEG